MALLVADFIGQTEADRPIPFLRDRNTRPDVVAYPIPSITGTQRREDIKSALEPIVEAMGDLQGFVNRVMRDNWSQADVERELRKSDEYRNKNR